jgi:hypothetical protein
LCDRRQRVSASAARARSGALPVLGWSGARIPAFGRPEIVLLTPAGGGPADLTGLNVRRSSRLHLVSSAMAAGSHPTAVAKPLPPRARTSALSGGQTGVRCPSVDGSACSPHHEVFATRRGTARGYLMIATDRAHLECSWAAQPEDTTALRLGGYLLSPLLCQVKVGICGFRGLLGTGGAAASSAA